MDNKDEANGFYSRTLQLAMGKSIEPEDTQNQEGWAIISGLLCFHRNGRGWIKKDYKNLLLALLTNGYSQTQIQRALHTLNLPYSQERIEDLSSLIKERCEAFKIRKSFTAYTLFSIH